MDRIRIVGGRTLEGSIKISGAKNAALPLMIASLLTRETLTLENTPSVADVGMLLQILSHHGVDYSVDGRRPGDEPRLPRRQGPVDHPLPQAGQAVAQLQTLAQEPTPRTLGQADRGGERQGGRRFQQIAGGRAKTAVDAPQTLERRCNSFAHRRRNGHIVTAPELDTAQRADEPTVTVLKVRRGDMEAFRYLA